MKGAAGRAVIRPFSVIGFTFFFTMLILYYAGIGLAWHTVLFFGVFFLTIVLVPRFRRQRVLLLMTASGAIAVGLFVFACKMDYEPALQLDGNTVQAKLVMRDDAQERGNRFCCAAVTDTVNGKPYRLKVLVSFRERPDGGAYDTVCGSFLLKRRQANGVAALQTDADSGSCLVAYPAEYSNESLHFQRLPIGEKPLRYRFLLLRDRLNRALQSVIGGERGALCSALLFGKSDAFPARLKARFNAVGVSHMVCVSGLHLSVWILGAYGILRRLRVKRAVAALLAIGLIFCYMALTAFPASVIRAGIMMSMVMAGKLFRRRGDGLNSLGLAATVMLVQNPLSIGDMGFTLSFLSTLGILLFAQKIQNIVLRPAAGRVPVLLLRMITYPVGVCSVTAAAMAFTMPLLLLNFGSVNLISFLGNLLMLPAVSCCMVTAGFTAVLACIPFLRWLAAAVGFVSALCSQYLIAVVTMLSGIRFVSLSPNTEAVFFWIIFSAVISVLGWHFFKRYPWVKRATALALVLCFAAVNLGSAIELQYATELRVIGVGNASAVLLKKGGKAVLLGCGRDGKDSFYKISDVLEEAHISSLQLMLLPTAEAKDSGNAAYILQHFHADELAYYKGFSSLNFVSESTRCVHLAGTMRRTLWKGCVLTVTVGEGGCYAVAETCGIRVLLVFGDEIPSLPADFLAARAVPLSNAAAYSGVLVSGDKGTAEYGENARILFTGGEHDIVLRMRPEGKFQLIQISEKTE